MYQTIFHYLLCLRDKNRNETIETIRYDTIRCDTIRYDTGKSHQLVIDRYYSKTTFLNTLTVNLLCLCVCGGVYYTVEGGALFLEFQSSDESTSPSDASPPPQDRPIY